MEENEDNYQQRMSDEQGQVEHNNAWGEPTASLPKVPRPIPVFGEIEHALVQPVDVYNTLEEIAEELRQQVMWEYNPDIWNIMHKLRRTIDTGAYINRNPTE